MRAAAAPSTPPPLRVAATYNVHRWVGSDGRYDPERTLAVLRELQAHVIALQEATLLFGEPAEPAAPVPPRPQAPPATTAEFLARRTGMQVVAGPTLVQGGARFGNLLLTALPILAVRRHDLSLPGREPRGLLDVELALQPRPGGACLRVLVTHLGLRHAERRAQVGRLMDCVAAGPTDNVLLLGDLNQWFPWLGALGPINRWFGASPVRRSFPARVPVFPLDRIWLQPRDRLEGVRAHRTPLARLASDHLPVKAWISGA